MHRVSEKFFTSTERRLFDTERLLGDPLRRMRPYLVDSDPDDRAVWETLSQIADQAAAVFAEIQVKNEAIGPIHGDLHQGNCHFNDSGNGGQLTFFDFSNAAVGWRVYDLSGFLWPPCVTMPSKILMSRLLAMPFWTVIETFALCLLRRKRR